jgi:arylsulfatase A-like enzyme
MIDAIREYGPERLQGQGLDPNQFESADRTIEILLATKPAADQVDFVATWREGAYEVWARRGMIRFKRLIDEAGELHFEIIEQIGDNPIARQDPFAIATIADELRAASASGCLSGDPNAAYIEPTYLTYPHAYERIAQFFDSPRGSDLFVNQKCYAYGVQPGQHGTLDVLQSRAPLALAGPGIAPGRYRLDPRHVDIAPTIARLLGFPTLREADTFGAPSKAAAKGRPIYLKRQDGRVIDEILDHGSKPERVYLIVFDGLAHSELIYLLEERGHEIPNIAKLIGGGALFTHGSTVNFPSITWPSHSTILTGTWSGHHDIVNPAFYDSRTRAVVPLQARIFATEGFLGDQVETLYEACKRVFGSQVITASIHEPQGRSADHAAFERRLLGDKTRLKALTAELSGDLNPRWEAEGNQSMAQEERVDARGLAQVLNLFEHCKDRPPVFVAHEFVLTDGAGHDYGPHHEAVREALGRSDARLGVVLEVLQRMGLFDSTLFVITSDHGMASQRTELKANPACEPRNHGIKGVFVEPMIYLRDMAVRCQRSRDGRALRVEVTDNDANTESFHAPIAGARVWLWRGEELLFQCSTSFDGVAAFATPIEASDRELRLRVEHQDLNPRNLLADGSPLGVDLRTRLYGSAVQ